MSKKVLTCALVLLSVTAVANAEFWWQLGGADRPSTVQASDGTNPFAADPASATLGKFTTVAGADTALQVTDNSALDNPVWTTSAFPAASAGATIALGLKANSCPDTGDQNILTFNNWFAGNTIHSRFTLRMYKDPGTGYVMLKSRDSAVGGSGYAPQRIDDAFHNIWIYGAAGEVSGKIRWHLYFDGQPWGLVDKNTSDPTEFSFGTGWGNSGTVTSDVLFDYIALNPTGAHSLNTLAFPTSFPGNVPEPATLTLLALAAMPLLGRRRAR